MSTTLEKYAYFLTNASGKEQRGVFVLIGGFARFDDLEGLKTTEKEDSPLLKFVRDYDPDKQIVFAKIDGINPISIGIMSLVNSDRIMLQLPSLLEKSIEDFWDSKDSLNQLIQVVNN